MLRFIESEYKFEYLKLSILVLVVGIIYLVVSIFGKNYEVLKVSALGQEINSIVKENKSEITYRGSKNWQRSFFRSRLDINKDVLSTEHVAAGEKILAKCHSDIKLCLKVEPENNVFGLLIEYDRVSNSLLIVFTIVMSFFGLFLFTFILLFVKHKPKLQEE